MSTLKVFYVWDDELIEHCDRLPAVADRAKIVHSLIAAYGILEHFKIVRPKPASYEDLREFHSELYLNHLKELKEIDDDYTITSQDEEYGIGYDCPPVSDMYELVSTISGGTLTGAKCLLLGIADVAINWCGGWHHSHRFGAEGFCYVNDIVLAIQKLKLKFPKVLYIDLDVHHGNGVQDAFSLSNSVFTLSFHKFEPGFYPGTGSLDDIGKLTGTGYSCNVPLHANYSDDTMEYVFSKVFSCVYERFSPNAIVVQCGADALAGDPLGGACLTARGYRTCLSAVLDKRKPTLLLGGGGYKNVNAARLWASLTASVVGLTLDDEIPEHTYWPHYGPGYTVAIDSTLVKDNNTREYLDGCISIIQGNLEKHLKNECKESVKAKTEGLLMNNAKETRLDYSIGVSKINKKINTDYHEETKDPTKDVYEFSE